MRSPVSSAYSTSTDLSPPFTYSTTRPPTTFSQYISNSSSNSNSKSQTRSRSWSRSSNWGKSPLQPPEEPLPDLPITQSPFNDNSYTDTEYPNDAFNRSNWSSTTPRTGDLDTIKSTGYSRTSYKPSSRPLQTIPPDTYADENAGINSTPGWSAKTTVNRVKFAEDQDMIMDSPNQITPATELKHTRDEKDDSPEKVPWNGSHDQLVDGRSKERHSTLPSILSISRLANVKSKIIKSEPVSYRNGASSLTDIENEPSTDKSRNATQANGRSDHSLLNVGVLIDNKAEGIYQRKTYNKSRTPDITRQQTKLLDIQDQNKLGRMSVATRRYTLPPQRKAQTDHPKSSDMVPSKKIKGILDSSSKLAIHEKKRFIINLYYNICNSAPSKIYLTYRPFFAAVLSLCAALILVMTHGITNDSTIGQFLFVNKDVFDISRAGGTDIVLGIWGWCQSDQNQSQNQCQNYGFRDFANDQLTFTIPGDPSLEALSLLLTALTTLTWLLAIYQIVIPFLHFYLFFALSIPFNHLVEITQSTSQAWNHLSPRKKESKSPSNNSSDANDHVIAEVDLRVKCERFPYESYLWVWWAWWAHRRSPVGHVFGCLVGLLGLITFGMTFKFRSSIINATGSTNLSLGTGAYIPLMTVLITIDTFVLSLMYFWSFRKKLELFLNPPSPSPRVLLLAPSENAILQHHRQTGIQSFFAPYENSFIDYKNEFEINNKFNQIENQNQNQNEIEIDEETKRWLEA
ncbi:uncharacterized protein I206_100833 [Kwoniella pini CBS 10737]|uniref:Uncharacterized protein n=1 Tax=Kwoniella pini CBS 10737 TaxID=1296096 RepID=A0A1B9IC43_9TREE|nr:uncharacterized protein I206_00493 [Kwoniella pini CBS 10737]OCF53192.1 hypothetical protein I206_00493 [Kwoniella pini CBS 10737]